MSDGAIARNWPCLCARWGVWMLSRSLVAPLWCQDALTYEVYQVVSHTDWHSACPCL